MADPTPDKRLPLLLTLATMPEESWGWFVSWAMTGFPPTGGFKPESRLAIKRLQKDAQQYLKAYEKAAGAQEPR